MMKLFSPVAMVKSIRILLAIAAYSMTMKSGKWMSKPPYLKWELRRGCVHDTSSKVYVRSKEPFQETVQYVE